TGSGSSGHLRVERGARVRELRAEPLDALVDAVGLVGVHARDGLGERLGLRGDARPQGGGVERLGVWYAQGAFLSPPARQRGAWTYRRPLPAGAGLFRAFLDLALLDPSLQGAFAHEARAVHSLPRLERHEVRVFPDEAVQ